MTYTQYTAVEGDTWTLISFKSYGTVDKVSDLVEANPKIPKSVLIDPGTVMNIPILEIDMVVVQNLPPWKR